MPGFVTHYLFGVSTFHRMKDTSFHNLIQCYPHAYALGLQGPDIFFYYLPGFRKHPAPGSAAHARNTNQFLGALLERARAFSKQQERDIALCYAAGFLGHYTLDTTCHPYIYAKTNYRMDTPDYFGRHVYLETDIDKAMLMKYKKLPPSGFRQSRIIRLTHRERRVVAHCLHYAYVKAFPELRLRYPDMYGATLLMPLGLSVLYDPYGKKKVLVRQFEKHFPGFPYISPLIASDLLRFTKDPLNRQHRKWKNPWNASHASTDSFDDLFKTAQKRYLKRLALLEAAQHQALMRDLGNLSYSTGLPVTPLPP